MPGSNRNAGAKPKDAKRTFSRFLKSVKPWRGQMILMILMSIAGVLLSVFGPIIMGKMTTSATDSISRGEGINWQEVGGLALLLIGLYLASAVVSYIEGIVMSIVSAKYTKYMRGKILAKISKLPMGYFDKVQIGDIMSIMTNDVDAVAGELADTITEIVTSVTTILGILAMMLYISVPLSLIAIVAIPISTFFVSKIAGRSEKYFKSQRKLLGSLNSKIEEDYTGQLLIKANDHAARSISDFRKVNSDLYNASFKSQFFGSMAFPVTHIFTNIAYVAITVVGGFLAINGAITIGNVQAFIQYVNRFNRPITEVAQLSATIQQILAAAERIFDFLDAEEENDSRNSEFDEENVTGAVKFHDVSFSYDKVKPVITNFTADVRPGMQVAIVGPTGAGKTTMVNLLMRFYDPDSGYITIDGKPISEMSRGEVRSMFGMVLQDTWLFSGTIMDNLRYGLSDRDLLRQRMRYSFDVPNSTSHSVAPVSSNLAGQKDRAEVRVREAVEAVGLTHFIESLPKGFDTEISEDSDNLSAGEKQLLTIARVLAADPPMIILDEATSNVDTRTEQQIQDAFSKLTSGRTSFVIAHRLSTIRNADLILVMKDGNIIEQGRHEELLNLNGFYSELYNSQFQE